MIKLIWLLLAGGAVWTIGKDCHTNGGRGMMTREELLKGAEHIARETCRPFEDVLKEVGELDRMGQRFMLIDWLTGRIEPRD